MINYFRLTDILFVGLVKGQTIKVKLSLIEQVISSGYSGVKFIA